MQQIHQRDRRAVMRRNWVEPYEEHRMICEAIMARDAKNAAFYMNRHLDKVGRIYEKLYGLE